MRISVVNLSVVTSIALSGAISSIASAGTLYATNNSAALFTVDTSDASLTSVSTYANSGDGEAIAYHPPSGNLYRWTGNSTRAWSTIDPSNSYAQSSLTPDGSGEVMSGIWDSANNQFFLTTLSGYWATMPDTGGITDHGLTDPPCITRGVAFIGSTLYGLEHFDDLDVDGFVDLLTIDPATGDILSATEINIPGFTGEGAFGLAYDPDTNTLYGGFGYTNTSAGRFLATIDPSTGVGTRIGDFTSNGINSLAVIPTGIVPEPTSLALLAAGAMLTLRRKR